MVLLTSLWRTITHTKALEDSSGEIETTFFESLYRITYIAGLSNSDHSFFYKLYSNTVKLIIATFIMGEVLYMITIVSSLDIAIEQMNAILILLMAVFRYKYMRMHEPVYKKLATSMQFSNLDTSTPARKALVEYWTERSETYLKLMVGLGSVTLAIWDVYPLVDDIDYNLNVGLWLGVDFSRPSRYPIAYTLNIVAFHCAGMFIMVNDTIMQTHLIHLVCQYTVLADCFENIIVDCEKDFEGLSRDQLVRDSRFREVYIFRLGLLVEQHKNILMHTMELRKTISLPMLGQMAASAMQICFSGYQVATTLTVSLTKFSMSLLFLGYNSFELFVLCRWCNEIKIQSENISYAMYCSGWECGVATMAGVRARLMLVVTRASKPLVLTAGGITDLSLESYFNLVKTSYSALTVLLRLRHE
ncbi:odorant receptor 94a-like [Cydia strobilella]|uniref:odorant receptor 94a-like n=1 Tax=Cydia strobilella TaxID=1100964 RepID=UPI003003D169